MNRPALHLLIVAAGLALSAGLARAAAPLWVNRTPTEFNALLDADGDGDLDAVVADRETGLLRVGRRTNATTFTWETPVPGGLAPLDGLAAGLVLTNAHHGVALAGQLANRVALVDLATASTARTPTPLFPRHTGPQLVAALDAFSTHAGDELFVASQLNGGSWPSHRQLFRRTGASAYSEADYDTGSSLFSFVAAITATNNAIPRVAGLCPDTGRLWLFGVSTNGATIEAGPYRTVSAGETSQFVYGFYAPGAAYGQFLVYTPGTTSARRVALQADATYGAAFGTAYSLTLPAVPRHLAPGPATNQVTLVATNGAASVYTYNGTSLSLVNALALPAGTAGAFLGSLTDPATGTTLMLLDTDGDGRSDQSCRYGLSGGQIVALDAPASLSSLANREGRPNTLAFIGEPLVASNATRVAAYSVSDWSTSKSGVTPSTSVSAAADRGAALGLGTPAVTTVSGVPADATYILVDQLATDIGVAPLFSAAGESVSTVRIDPDGGTFDNAVSVTLSAPASAGRIIYRLSTSDTWTEYVGTSLTFWLFKDTTVQCFGFNNSNDRTSPITSATFTFTQAPEKQDADGDGVPDFVELQLGLDPTSGSDADDDGLSDLDELLGGTKPNVADSDGGGATDRQERAAGTNPNNPADDPSPEVLRELDGNDLSANERRAVYDLRLGPEPYDGFLLLNTNCASGVPCQMTALDGSLLGTASTSPKGFPGIRNPALAFSGLPTPFEGLFASFTTPAHFDIATTRSDKSIGRELVKLLVAPPVPSVAVSYTWTGGVQAVETAAWTNAARTAYMSASRTIVSNSVNYYDTLTAALFETFAASNLQARGLLATNAASLFPSREEPPELPHPTARQLLTLQTADPSGHCSAYQLTNTLSWLRVACETNTHTQVSTLRNVVRSVYRYSCVSNNAAPGRYPLPLDALRQLIRAGTVPGGYTNHISASTAATAKLGAHRLLGLIPARQRVQLDLLASAPQTSDKTVLLALAGGLRYSLVEANGDAFGMSLALAVPSNSTVRVDGFLNGPDVKRGANYELEVISLTVTALTAPTPADLNANLIPDDYELLVFGSAGAAPTRDSDGDTFSDLQEYLENTDPTSDASVPSVPAADLSAPEVTISLDGAAVSVAWAWPARYQSRFAFTVETTDDLRGSPFTVRSSATPTSNGDAMRFDLPRAPEGPTRFYRVRTALR
jgi:hypothetical protein